MKKKLLGLICALFAVVFIGCSVSTQQPENLGLMSVHFESAHFETCPGRPEDAVTVQQMMIKSPERNPYAPFLYAEDVLSLGPTYVGSDEDPVNTLFYDHPNVWIKAKIVSNNDVQYVSDLHEYGFTLAEAKISDVIRTEGNGVTPDSIANTIPSDHVYLAQSYIIGYDHVRNSTVYARMGTAQQPLVQDHSYMIRLTSVTTKYEGKRIFTIDDGCIFDLDADRSDPVIQKMKDVGLYANYDQYQATLHKAESAFHLWSIKQHLNIIIPAMIAVLCLILTAIVRIRRCRKARAEAELSAKLAAEQARSYPPVERSRQTAADLLGQI